MVSEKANRECNDILTQLESWYARENGQYLLASTRESLQPLLDTSFGYHILQLGVSRGHSLLAGSPIHHRVYATDHAGEGVSLVADPHELPLESDSVDMVIVHHCLEFAANPHQVLREIQRVLTPQGQLLLIGFNPYSIKGLAARLQGLLPGSLWRQHQPLSEARLTDWLHLLGCEVQSCQRLYNVPPLGRGRLREWLISADQWCNRHNLPVGGLSIVHAIKQTPAINRPRSGLRLSRQRLMGLAVPKPAPAPSPTPATTPVLHRDTLH